MNKIFSHGKLLLSSEYVILDGALALAIPTKMGQSFSFKEVKNGLSQIHWTSLCQGKLWFDVKINSQNWKITETNDEKSALFILKILKEIQKYSSKFQENDSYSFQSDLDFPQNFGLGSSSTLITNLAKWAKINAFDLNNNILGGSGYDISVAQESSAILYKLQNGEKLIEKINFTPTFKNELIFIHLNQKQNSREGIQLYRSKNKSKNLIQEFSQLTRELLHCKNIHDFSALMTTHEEKLSQFLELKTAKEKHFPDCPTFVKSLGAWGGDFVLTKKFGGYSSYFREKGFENIFAWEDLIFTPQSLV